MNTKYSPCKLNTYDNHYFIGFEDKRFIVDKTTKKIVRNRVLERDMKEEQYLEYEKKINEKLKIGDIELTNLKKNFLFTESYGDRNICHWITEQLMVLNYYIYLIELVDNLNENSKSVHENYPNIIININRRESMQSVILDYVKSVPKINDEHIVEFNLNKDMVQIIDCDTIYLGDAISCNLDNIYPLWEQLHSRLNISLAVDNTFPTKFYMSRRNIYQPDKYTNTRILENFENVSDTIVDAGYTEIFTDKLKTLGDRINLFKNAKEIICELGAGMHNLLYCSEGTKVIVMYQKNNISWLEEYYPLFRYKKMNVQIIAGETTSLKHNGNWLNTPWKLNIDELKLLLKN